MLRACGWVALIGMQLSVAALSHAQATPSADGKPARPARPAAPKPPSVVDQIEADLRAKEPERRAEAVEKLRPFLRQESTEPASLLSRRFLKPLHEDKRWEEIVTLGQEAILAQPVSTTDVEAIQFARVRALLRLNRPDEAVSQAKALYNVSMMGSTREALLLLAECLNAARKDDGASVEQLSQEQMAGAEYQPSGGGATTQPAAGEASLRDAANGTKSAVMGSIKIDPAPYAAAIEAIQAEDYRSLVAKGNLLLLADRADEAVKVFERAYAVADKKDLVAASENIARAMKAQDGTIGRANAWVLSLRPTKQP
jgi:tetratricopeptide (TPR) repeat protein